MRKSARLQKLLRSQEQILSKDKSAEQQNQFHLPLSNTHYKEAC